MTPLMVSVCDAGMIMSKKPTKITPFLAIFNQPDDVLTHCIGICEIYSIEPINGRVMYLPSSFSNSP